MNRSSRTLMSLPVSAVALAGFGGCTGTPQYTYDATEKIVFLAEWTQRMDYMGFVPIFPAIEDLRVGDMYVYSVNPTRARSAQEQRAAAREIAATTRWGSLPVLDALAREYRQRPAWPQTPQVYLRGGTADGDAPWPEARVRDGRSIFNPQETPTRLPAVGMETFTTVSFSGTNLETIIPTEVATLVTGRTDSDNLSVTIRAGSAESYALSMSEIIAALAEPAAPVPEAAPVEPAEDSADAEPPAAAPAKQPPRYRVRRPYRDNLGFVGGPGHDRVWLHVVTEVVYMRSADVSIRVRSETPKDDQVSAHELEQGPPPPAVAGAAPADTGTEGGEPPAAEEPAAPAQAPEIEKGLTAYGATPLDPIYGAFVRAEAINRKLEDMAVDDLPGGSVSFLSVTDDSMALRRVWSRGLAIGVKGLFLEVDVETGNIISGGAMHWPVAVSMGK